MSLLTLVQLNILLAAAPALAGWVLLLPLTHPILVRTACVPVPAICREGPPVSSALVRRAARSPLCPRPAPRQQVFVAASPLLETFARPSLALSAAALLSHFTPFPHAARAP